MCLLCNFQHSTKGTIIHNQNMYTQIVLTHYFLLQFIPNVNEVEILNVILRALSFFSSPRDQGDSGSGEPTGPPGTEGPTGPPGTGGGPQDPHKPHKGPILPDPLPPGEIHH